MILLHILSGVSLIAMLVISMIYSLKLIKNFKNLKKLQPFIWILIFSTSETLFNITFSQILDKPEIFLSITNYTQKLFLVLEIIVIIYFYAKIEFSVNTKVFLKPELLYSIYALTFLTFIIGIYFNHITLFITILELIVVDYFFIKTTLLEIWFDQQIKFQYQKILNQGIFIFINLISPYSIINELIDQGSLPIYLSLNFINDIGYIILFNSLYKSSICYQ